jgi:hypothetical protein
MAAAVSTAGSSRSALGFLPVQASLSVRDLVIASWETDRDSVLRPLPAGLEPAQVDGRFLVSLAAFQVQGGRVGPLPVIPYAQLNVRTYVSWKGEPAVFFLAARVSVGGVAGALLGAPFRYARVRVREGSVRAPGRGISLRYRLGGRAEPGALGHHELGLYDDGELRQFHVERAETDWHRGELVEPARADFLVALGFELRGEPELLCAERASFVAQVPPQRV